METQQRAKSGTSVKNLHMHEGPWALAVAVDDRVGCPVGERADGAGRVVAMILREHARAHDEQVRYVPALQVAVDDAVARIVAHDRPAGVVSSLVWNDRIRRLARLRLERARLHRLRDLGRL